MVGNNNNNNNNNNMTGNELAIKVLKCIYVLLWFQTYCTCICGLPLSLLEQFLYTRVLLHVSIVTFHEFIISYGLFI